MGLVYNPLILTGFDRTSSGGGGGSGTVTSVSVVTANGLAGTVANNTTTPAITLSTTVTGILKGNGTTISAATPGTDYVIPSGNITGTASNITATSNSTITTLSSLSLPGTQVTGNISGSAGSISGTNVITNSNLATMAAHTYKGNNTGSTATPIDVTATQVTADLNLFTTSLQGLVPASGGGTSNFLRADGTFAAPSGTAGITSLTGDVTGTGPGATATTLATVNTNVGSFGSSTSIPSFTVNAKGLITAASGNVVIAPAGTLNGTTLNSTVVTSSLTSVGTQSQALNMGSNQINAVSDPSSAQDAVTLNYLTNNVPFSSPGDINQTSFTAADNQVSPADVTSFTFTNASVRSFDALVSIIRNNTYAVFKMQGIQKASTWELSQDFTGDTTGLTFSITNAGQIQYTSSSTGFTATVKFRAIVTSV